MNTSGQIKYWVESGREDFLAAQSLLEKGHFRHCLFFAHLAIEKTLKAHVVKKTQNIPPRIHNLVRLCEIAELRLTQEKMDVLHRFGLYQLEGRYPDTVQAVLDEETTKAKLLSVQEILLWLTAQL